MSEQLKPKPPCQHVRLTLKLGGYVCESCRKVVYDFGEILSKEGHNIFDLVEGFMAVDPKDFKAYYKAVDKILPQIDEIMHKRRIAGAKARKVILD